MTTDCIPQTKKERKYKCTPKPIRDQIIREYESGTSIRQLMEKYGKTYDAINAMLYRRGIVRRYPTVISEDHRREILSMRAANYSMKEIADKLGFGKTTIARVLRRSGGSTARPKYYGKNRFLSGLGLRVCCGCGYEGPEEDFYQSKHNYRRYCYCKRCCVHRAAATGKKARKERRQLITQLKGNTCADCKNTYPTCVLDFHHVRGEKRFILSEGARGQWTKQDIILEAAKCDVLCSNCHRIRTHGGSGQ